MKITKAQKDAVISLLKEKFEDKNKEIKKAYIEAHKAEIEAKVNRYLELQEEAKVLANRLRDIYKETKAASKLKDGDLNTRGIYPSYRFYDDSRNQNPIEGYNREQLFESIFVSKVKEPNYDIVSRELELASLGKDFDLEGFLAKYLPE